MLFRSLGNNVLNTYINEFIPSALNLSENIYSENNENKYPWTTGSWLLWEFMQKANIENNNRIEEAINRSDFYWHAFPFTMEAELCDSSLFSSAFNISKRLDSKFGRKTIAAKITDVPGITRGVIPIMKKNGITLLHIGTNPCIPLPEVPTLFRWKNTDGSEINVIYQLGYGEFLKIPGSKIAAYLCFTSDNHGPHTKEQIDELYDNIKKRFPNAKIIASSLNDIAKDIEKYSINYLPIVTSEIGDSWIWGIASDPKKIAEFNTLMRLRTKWVEDGRLIPGSDLDINFSLPLLLVSEHTWGLDVKWNLNNWDKYDSKELEKFQNSDICKRMESSWNEKRKFITDAISVLPTDLQRETFDSLSLLNPVNPVIDDFVPFDAKKTIKTEFFKVSFSPVTGAITQLYDVKSKIDWTNKENNIGEFAYQTFSEDVFKKFISNYCPPNPPDWAKLDYGKHLLGNTDTPHKTWVYNLENSYENKSKEGVKILLELKPLSSDLLFGAPNKVYITYFFPSDKKQIEISVDWFDKKKNRIPEAIWFSMVPALGNKSSIILNKMNSDVNVNDIVNNGSKHQHAVTGSIKINDDIKEMKIKSWDAPLVILNQRDIMYFDNKNTNPAQGLHFCLFNNTWGTNYPQWFGDDMRFRFLLSF